MTTDESPLREKIGQPEGEVEVIEVGVNYQDQKEIERKNDNSPTASETELSGDRRYSVTTKKYSDKKDEEKAVTISFF